MSLRQILVVQALEQERVALHFPEVETRTLFTGMSKVPAAVVLMKALEERIPSLVLNVGTAGTLHYEVGDILVCRRFVDRDCRRANLPGLDWMIDEGNATEAACLARAWPSVIGGKETWQHFTVSTGDSFVTEVGDTEQGDDVFDMEAYAYALVCRTKGVPFLSVKCVTDVVGRNSVRHWEEKLLQARENLDRYFAARAL